MPKPSEQAAFGIYPQAGKRGQRKPTAREQLAQIFSDDRAMEMPQFGEVDLGVPTAANRAMGQRMVERDVDLKRQSDQDMSPLEKIAGGMQTGRLIGSGMYQAAKSLPTAITKGGKAAEEYIAENIYKPNQPKAYEYAGDIGDFLSRLETDYKIPPIIPEAVMLQSVIGPATRQAGRAAQRGARQGALNLAAPRTLNPQAGVIKMKGGNWLGGSVEGVLKNLKRPDRMTGGKKDPSESLADMRARYTPEAIAELPPELRGTVLTAIQELEKKVALNNWVDRNLTNYVKKDMATPEDPVRRLAEEGIIHIPSDQVGSNRYDAPRHRNAYGGEQLGKSEAARAWEDASDVAINAPTARTVRANESLYQENPWTEKLSPDDRVYALNKPGYREPEINSLGFDHIMDVLREDVNSGRIRPEQLNKVSMEQAVRRTYEYDQELAAKMNAARVAQREGLPVYKEYPEGYRWVELNKPGAFASESEAMGHSVRGYEPPQGHPDWVEGSGGDGHLGYGHGGWEAIKSGKAKVYSLVDSKGQPHVTIESRAPDARSNYEEMRAIENQVDQEADAQGFANFSDRDRFTSSRVQELKSQLMAQKQPEGDYRITQIKGKSNAAPKEDYLPFVQDFVKSGQWSDVGDIQNSGLYKLDKDFLGEATNRIPRGETSGMFLPHERQELILKAMESKLLPERGYITEKEYEDALRSVAPPPTPGPTMEFLREMAGMPPEGMARGGPVHFSGNPDVMQLELAGGGLVGKLAKLARAPAKSKAEISAIAERLAPQVTGEYVRKDAKSAQTVADKTQKQFQREKTLPVDVRPTAELRTPEPVDIEKLRGDVMIGIRGDPTLTGKTLYSVGDVKLESPSPQHGGPLYGLYSDDNFWASGLSPARGVQNLAKRASEQYDAPVKGSYIMMGPESINYAQHFADANLQAIDLSKMSKAQINQFNELIRKGSPESGPRKSFPGIEDKGDAYLQFAMDPKLRKHFNALMQMPTVTEKLNLPSGTDIRFAITEPSLRDLETGVTGYSMGRMRPDISSKDLPLSTHPTYDFDIPGEFMGQSKYPMPYELTFPDTLKSVRENPKQAESEFGSLNMVGPRQTIDQQMIDEIKAYEERMRQLTGKKAGGAVRKAAGGEITADDLILEERKL